jgi:metal-sulfur cluster biosynthetic enzyme
MLQNANPTVYSVSKEPKSYPSSYYDESVEEPLTLEEVFDRIRNINDPEHPLTLEQLNVVQIDHVSLIVDEEDGGKRMVIVEYTPTIPHCSMATLIGLSIKVCLLRSIPAGWSIDVFIRKGTHQSEDAINKQLRDKERVAAALENANLLSVVHQCLRKTLDPSLQ